MQWEIGGLSPPNLQFLNPQNLLLADLRGSRRVGRLTCLVAQMEFSVSSPQHNFPMGTSLTQAL